MTERGLFPGIVRLTAALTSSTMEDPTKLGMDMPPVDLVDGGGNEGPPNPPDGM